MYTQQCQRHVYLCTFIYLIKVEDVYDKFEKLRKLKENNWEKKQEGPKAQPKKKIKVRFLFGGGGWG